MFYSCRRPAGADDVSPYDYQADVLWRINDQWTDRIEELPPLQLEALRSGRIDIDRALDVVLAGRALGDPALNCARTSTGTKR
ncbi:hypothetical protein VSR34_25060 [Paraburkholderia sp. JHI2823]|uniref:hypothetical protein n=1 Tax=Paraburkholderia sp. JHI2823 TaxID=3112960 RepID=UPI00317564C9